MVWVALLILVGATLQFLAKVKEAVDGREVDLPYYDQRRFTRSGNIIRIFLATFFIGVLIKLFAPQWIGEYIYVPEFILGFAKMIFY